MSSNLGDVKITGDVSNATATGVDWGAEGGVIIARGVIRMLDGSVYTTPDRVIPLQNMEANDTLTINFEINLDNIPQREEIVSRMVQSIQREARRSIFGAPNTPKRVKTNLRKPTRAEWRRIISV